MIDLIYCAGGNKKLDMIAQDAGFMLGVRSDLVSYFPVAFVDIDYKKPDFHRHWLRVVAERPKYAVLPDLPETPLSDSDVCRVVTQYLWLRPYCDYVVIVPKVTGQIAEMPNEADIVIGYSVPTSYGGAKYPLRELKGRKVHLLGGSPAEQRRYYKYITAMDYGEIVSVDGSAAKKGAVYGDYWSGTRWQRNEYDGQDHYYDSWRKSCDGIKAMWLNV